MPVPAPITALVRAVSWHRRGLAAVLAAVSVLALYAALRPGTSDQVTVLVATRTIGSGQVADAGSLATMTVPRSIVPAEALTSPEQAVGRIVTGGLSDNAILTARSVLTPNQQVDGLVVVPVRVADADVAALLQPGDRVDLFGAGSSSTSADGSASSKLAAGAVVVTVAQPAQGPVSGISAGGDGALVLVRVPPSVAPKLAQTGAAVTVVFR